MPLRANTTTQVCWHRTTTVGMADMQAMLKVVLRLTTALCVFLISLFWLFSGPGLWNHFSQVILFVFPVVYLLS